MHFWISYQTTGKFHYKKVRWIYDLCRVICPSGIYSSLKVLQGLKNAGPFSQCTIEPLFEALRKNLKAWLDDFMLHAQTEEQLLHRLEEVISICDEHNLFLSAKKSILFDTSIHWCGRIINKDGYKMDPTNAEGIRTMIPPIAAEELSQFIHCCRWMSTAIPDFAKRSAPLVDVLERAYRKAERRKRNAIKGMKLSELGLAKEQDKAFKYIQSTINVSIKLAFPKEGYAVCIHTYASDRFWSTVVTQTKEQ